MVGTSRAVAALLASVLLASPVMAQPNGPPNGPSKPPPTDQQKQQAGDLVKRAIAKSQSGDHLGAIELYLQAYALIPAALLLSNIGAEYQLAQKPVEALKYFCKYLESDPTGTSADYATAQAKVLQIQLGNKDVDDKAVCKAPEPVKPIEQPVKPIEDHHETTAAPGRSSMEYAGMGVGALGVVSVGLGIFFGVKAKNASDEISNWPAGTPWPSDIVQRQADGQSDENKQIGFLVVGGVALVAGGVLYYLGHKHRSEATEKVVLVPVASPGGAGVVLGGRF